MLYLAVYTRLFNISSHLTRRAIFQGVEIIENMPGMPGLISQEFGLAPSNLLFLFLLCQVSQVSQV
jgi:hypothetical protein